MIFVSGYLENRSVCMQKEEYCFYFGKKAIEAGFIQTFLLLFSCLEDSKAYEALLPDIAMAFRPVLYGFCFFLLLKEQEETMIKSKDKEETKEPIAMNISLKLVLPKEKQRLLS